MTWSRWTATALRMVAALTVPAITATAAGPVPAAADDLAGPQRQRLDWHTCQRGSADPSGAELDQAGAPAPSWPFRWTMPARTAAPSPWHCPGCRRPTPRTGSASCC